MVDGLVAAVLEVVGRAAVPEAVALAQAEAPVAGAVCVAVPGRRADRISTSPRNSHVAAAAAPRLVRAAIHQSGGAAIHQRNVRAANARERLEERVGRAAVGRDGLHVGAAVAEGHDLVQIVAAAVVEVFIRPALAARLADVADDKLALVAALGADLVLVHRVALVLLEGPERGAVLLGRAPARRRPRRPLHAFGFLGIYPRRAPQRRRDPPRHGHTI